MLATHGKEGLRAALHQVYSAGFVPSEFIARDLRDQLGISADIAGDTEAAHTATVATAQNQEDARLGSRITPQQQADYVLPSGASPDPAMTQRQLEQAGARHVGATGMKYLDTLAGIETNLRTLVDYYQTYDLIPPSHTQARAQLQARYEQRKRDTARQLDQLGNVASEREGASGGIGLGGSVSV